MKNRSAFEKLGDFLLGKGFYIVLFLCVATIGISGYYLFHTLTDQPEELAPVGGDASVVLPDSEANGPDPADGAPVLTLPDRESVIPRPVTPPEREEPSQAPEQPDDPEPVKRPVESDPAPAKPAVYTWPVKGAVIRDFSVEVLSLDPTMGDWRTHDGLDIAAPLGREVLAMGAGTVVQVYEDGLMGATVIVDHGGGLTTHYSNLGPQATVEAGDRVEPGTILGAVGDTAMAESGLEAHLHLEAWKDGQPVDPRDYLPER